MGRSHCGKERDLLLELLVGLQDREAHILKLRITPPSARCLDFGNVQKSVGWLRRRAARVQLMSIMTYSYSAPKYSHERTLCSCVRSHETMQSQLNSVDFPVNCLLSCTKSSYLQQPTEQCSTYCLSVPRGRGKALSFCCVTVRSICISWHTWLVRLTKESATHGPPWSSYLTRLVPHLQSALMSFPVYSLYINI